MILLAFLVTPAVLTVFALALLFYEIERDKRR